MTPSFGSDLLHLGQEEEEVRAQIGNPASITRRHKGQYFYNYPDIGLEVDFGTRGGRVSYLFFFRDGFRGNRPGPMETIQGIRPGDPTSKVLQLLGRPTKQGEPVKLDMGGQLEAWFHYGIGINFQFGSDDVVNMITITAKD